MKLTRRDAIAALAAGGITISGGAVVLRWDVLGGDSESSIAFTEHEIETLNVLASVVYPSEVTGIQAFVETYVVGRVQNKTEKQYDRQHDYSNTGSDYAQGMKDALATLDEYATDWFGRVFAALEKEKREVLLSQMGVDTADPDPVGVDRDRVRYYLVNELLYALYTSPTGGQLVGLENPQGHPGGLASYQQGPHNGG